ncbi:MAG: efflux RND transporter periplasmic adaptor subunit [Gemmatales bacterium]
MESADLYSKVSGYLVEQTVDIGYRVKAGDVLARLSVPEYEKQVKQDTADVVRAEAKVDQMKSAITTAEADVGAAAASIALAQAELKSRASYRAFREKQRNRINELVARNAIEAKVADENEDQYQAAMASELAATEAVNAARQKEAAAKARVKQSQADLRYAEAEVVTAKARLEKSQVLLDYTVIRSPYSGVVTKRNFHPGDFVRSAEAGGDRTPVFAVERTDLMRIIIQVPERDVPFVEIGKQAVIEVDALPGVLFKTTGDNKVEISRLAASEDPHMRMMRTEVHVKNPDGKLRRGMFGRATLLLQSGSPGAMRVPSSTLTGRADNGKGAVRVVRDGKVATVPVTYGSDNGTEIEILTGLSKSDSVILRASGPLSDGLTVTETKTGTSSH